MVYLLTGVAGVIGTLLRYGLGVWTQQFISQTAFPVGTLIVNLVGCFALGWFSQWAKKKSGISTVFLTSVNTGLIGSFTTFSAFSVETVELFHQGLWGSGIGYIGLSLVGGLGLVWLGAACAGGRKGARPNG